MKIINNSDMPQARGHYSHCVEHQGVLYIAGQLPIEPTSRQVPEGIAKQTQLTLENLERVLLAAGSSRNRVLSCRVYITDIANWDEVNQVYAAFFGEHRPARAIVPCGSLHYGALIEIEAVAARGHDEQGVSDA